MDGVNIRGRRAEKLLTGLNSRILRLEVAYRYVICIKSLQLRNLTCSVLPQLRFSEMFCTVHCLLHTLKSKIQRNVWETCSQSLHLRNLSCSVFLHLRFGEIIGSVQPLKHTREKIKTCEPPRKQ